MRPPWLAGPRRPGYGFYKYVLSVSWSIPRPDVPVFPVARPSRFHIFVARASRPRIEFGVHSPGRDGLAVIARSAIARRGNLERSQHYCRVSGPVCIEDQKCLAWCHKNLIRIFIVFLYKARLATELGLRFLLTMNDDIKNHISLWLPAPPPTRHAASQRRLRAVLPAASMLAALPERWSAPMVTRLDPHGRTPRLAA